MRVTYASKQGQHHNESQDCIRINNQLINNNAGAFNSSVNLVCIADGVGGVPGGYEASKYILENFDLSPEINDERGLKDYLYALNRDLIEYASHMEEKRAMASTFTGLVVIGRKLYVMHAGNTRMYASTGGRLSQITADHTNFRALMADGVSEEEAQNIGKNVIYCCFGTGREEYLNALEVVELKLDEAPEYLVLTTDGIHDYVDDLRFEEILNANLDDRNKILELMDEADKNGSTDDRTVVIVRRKLI